MVIGKFLAFMTLFFGVVCHVATFLPSVHIEMGHCWPLHIGAMAAFGFMFVHILRVQSRRPQERPTGFFNRIAASHRINERFKSMILHDVPKWVMVITGLVVVYVGFNFFYSLELQEMATAAVWNGQFVLQSHGSFVRTLSEAEYHRMLAYEVRTFSGHWIIFSLIPAIYFVYVRPRLKADADRPPAPPNPA